MSGKLAHAVSLILSPHLFSVAVASIYWRHMGCAGGPLQLVLMVLWVSVIPFAFIYADYARGAVDIFVTRRSARPKYYLLTLLCYAAGAAVQYVMGYPQYLPFYACYFSVGVVLFAINYFWKISVHAACITGPSSMLCYMFGWSYAPLLLLVFPVAWARLRLRAHTLGQLVAGAAIAPLVTYIVVFALNATSA